MADILENIKNNLITILITAICSFLGFLLIGIFSDVLPAILPPLQKLPISLYLRTILLLITLLALLISTIIVFVFKSKPSQPRAMKGKFYGIPWTAEIDYSFHGEGEIRTIITWLCPKHKTPLDSIQTGNHHQLRCGKCNKIHEISQGGAPIFEEEAYEIIRYQILDKINLPK